MYDALGKYANLPLYKMFGGSKSRVLAYASTGELKSVEQRIEELQAKSRDIGLDDADKYELRALLQARIGRH